MGQQCSTGCRAKSHSHQPTDHHIVAEQIEIVSEKKYDLKKIIIIQRWIRGVIGRKYFKRMYQLTTVRSDRYKNSNSTDEPANSSLKKPLRVPRPESRQLESLFGRSEEPGVFDAFGFEMDSRSENESINNKTSLDQLRKIEPQSAQLGHQRIFKREQLNVIQQQLNPKDVRRRFNSIAQRSDIEPPNSINKSAICFETIEKIPTNKSFQQMIRMKDGSTYQGDWQNGKPHGKGTYNFPDGSQYQGDVCSKITIKVCVQWVYGKAYGHGQFKLPNGDKYQGEWINGNAIGQGTYTYANGVVYEGSWRNDCPNGYGKEVYPEGGYYEGTFMNGMKHGNGILYFANGEMYQGQFSQDQMEGTGVYIWPDQKCYEGTWKNSLMDGKGVLIMPNGSKYVGEYSRDKKHGMGTFYLSDGSRYTGQWYNGKQHGDGEFVTSSGVVKRGKWIAGKFQSNSQFSSLANSPFGSMKQI